MDEKPLCNTCENSARLIGHVRQFLSDWGLHQQGRINPSFMKTSVRKMEETLQDIDKGRG